MAELKQQASTPQAFAAVTARLEAQLSFLREVDQLKHILRRSLVMDGSRRENSAEHSWHIALAALLLSEHANAPVAVDRVIKMLLIHDIVEIDAGDTFAYDLTARLTQAGREEVAAQRLFGLLPDEQAAELLALWAEFEARSTPEAKFAHAIDRLLPMMQNFGTQGGSWEAHSVHRGLVDERARLMQEGALPLWEYVDLMLDEAVTRGYLAPKP